MFLSSLLLFFCEFGCEKDKVTEPPVFKPESSAELLLYLESAGDVMNKIAVPVLTAVDVFNPVGSQLIVDVRENTEFVVGHIRGAKNIQKDSLFTFISKNYSHYEEIVLVSASGQSAAYYTGLLRLAGFSNVYFMNFGMASWNRVFSSVWTDRIVYDPDSTIIFSEVDNPKGSLSPLPNIQTNSSAQTMQAFVNGRINAMIKEGFDENFASASSPFILKFSNWLERSKEYYTICLGNRRLYGEGFQDTSASHHLVGAILYNIPGPADLRSVSNLQTLPSTLPIAAYSGSGQESAFYAAYLRLLGYDVKSILFGMNTIDYHMLLRSEQLFHYAFQESDIMNYPFETGNTSKR